MKYTEILAQARTCVFVIIVLCVGMAIPRFIPHAVASCSLPSVIISDVPEHVTAGDVVMLSAEVSNALDQSSNIRARRISRITSRDDGELQYTWSIPSRAIESTGKTFNWQTTDAGTFDVILTTSNNCGVRTYTVTVQVIEDIDNSLPDLAIKDVTYTQLPVDNYWDVLLEFKVYNRGGRDPDAPVRIYAFNETTQSLLKDVSYSGIYFPSGHEMIISAVGSFGPEFANGENTIVLKVDPDDTISESNELNNIFTEVINLDATKNKPDLVVKDVMYKQHWAGEYDAIRAEICNNTSIPVNQYFSYRYYVNDRTMQSMATIGSHDCIYVTRTVSAFGIDPAADPTTYEVMVEVDANTSIYWNNIIDESDESNNTLTKDVVIGYDSPHTYGHILGNLYALVTVTVWYDFDITLLPKLALLNTIRNLFGNLVNVELIYANPAPDEYSSPTIEAAIVTECVADQGDTYLEKGLQLLSQGILPQGFNRPAFLEYVQTYIVDDAFNISEFDDCGRLTWNRAYGQIVLARYLGITQPGTVQISLKKENILSTILPNALIESDLIQKIQEALSVSGQANTPRIIRDRFDFDRRR